MMKQVWEHFFIGNDSDCAQVSDKIEWCTVHACQSCFQKKMGHTNELFFENEQNLYLNLLDIDDIFKKETHPIVGDAFAFIDKHIQSSNVLIHCNFGASRSPSIAFLYLSKKGILHGSYDEAIEQFRQLYPSYHPGMGMANYCKKYWQELTQK